MTFGSNTTLENQHAAAPETVRQDPKPHLVIGVGASAGGLEAFRQLLSALSPDCGMAFLLVQHLKPDHKSILGELLSKTSPIRVENAKRGAALQQNVVYVIPSNVAVAVVDNAVHLSRIETHQGLRLPVEHLFRSLATQLGPQAAGVILSGSGSDGSAGARALKASGGLIIAQLPTSARHASMPQEAINAGGVDLVIEIAEIHGELDQFLRLPVGEKPRLEFGVMVVPELGSKVRSAVRIARRTQRIHQLILPFQGVQLVLTARTLEALGDSRVVVSFQPLGGLATPPPTSSGMPSEAEQLERELAQTREELQNAVKDLEASNAELRLMNDESASMNEELHSANEELEATTEELRSLNEELNTVNAQLREQIDQLQQAHTDLNNFFASADIPILFLDRQLRVQRFTPAAGALLRLDHDDIGRHLGDYSRDALGEELLEHSRAVLQGGPTQEQKLRLAGGRRFSQRVLPYRSDDQTIRGVVIALVEVTELEQANDALRESEERLSIAQDAAGLGIHDHDIRQGRVRWDERVASLWGVEPSDSIAYGTFRSGLHPDDRDRVQADLDRAFDPRGTARFYSEYRVISQADLITRWVAATGHVFFEQGVAIRLVGTTQDITRRKQGERSRAILAAIVSGSDDAIVSKTPEGKILSWNAGAERMFGYTSNEAIGRSIHLIVPPELREEEEQLLSRIRLGHSVQLSTTRVAKDGRRLDMALTISPLFDDAGKVVGASKIARDVTRQNRLERELHDREESLRMAADAAAFGTFDLNIIERVGRWSPRLRQILGLDASAPIPWDPVRAGYVHPEDAQRASAKLRASLEPGGEGRFEDELRLTPKDGLDRWILVKSRTHFAGEGEARHAVRAVGAVIDITERKLMERRLIESESQLRRLFDQAPALIAVHMGKAHTYIYSNPAHDRAFGNRMVIGRSLAEAMPELAGQGPFELFDRVYASGDPVITRALEVTFDRKGTGRPTTGFYTQVLQPWFEADGQVAGVMSFAFEITAEVELRKRAAESEAQFRHMADNIAQLAWMADSDGSVTWYNHRWFEYTGIHLDGEHRRHWGEHGAHHPAHVERVTRKLQNCIETGEPWEDTFPLRGKDGQYRWFLSRALPIRDENGTILRWFGTNTDVTEQRRTAQQLREADRRKDEFLAMLGHELRNPLAALSSATELLMVRGADEAIRWRALGVLSRQSAHMTRLVDGLLEVSRITRGKIELDLGVIDLAAVAVDVFEDRLENATRRGLTLNKHLPKEPVWVTADSVRISQVLDNLLGNAIKFTNPPGSVNISIQLADDENAVLSVVDTGVGIREELLEAIFEPFQQDVQEIARSAGGLGIGLSLAKAIVELHGGSIEARSSGSGEGAEFRVLLPRASAAATATRPAPSSTARARRILVVEDNLDAADMLRDLLQLQGHEVAVMTDGSQVLEYLSHHAVDLVMCDLGLPKKSGYEVATELRADERFRQLPLVALSGYGQVKDIERSRQVGFDRHLTKPLSMDALSEVLSSLPSRA